MIITDGEGRPLEPPVAPGKGATVEQVIAFLRAWNAHHDHVRRLANHAFTTMFRKTVSRR